MIAVLEENIANIFLTFSNMFRELDRFKKKSIILIEIEPRLDLGYQIPFDITVGWDHYNQRFYTAV